MIKNNYEIFRVGKCHGYDGYIRVKKLASWSKKAKIVTKNKPFLGRYVQKI